MTAQQRRAYDLAQLARQALARQQYGRGWDALAEVHAAAQLARRALGRMLSAAQSKAWQSLEMMQRLWEARHARLQAMRMLFGSRQGKAWRAWLELAAEARGKLLLLRRAVLAHLLRALVAWQDATDEGRRARGDAQGGGAPRTARRVASARGRRSSPSAARRSRSRRLRRKMGQRKLTAALNKWCELLDAKRAAEERLDGLKRRPKLRHGRMQAALHLFSESLAGAMRYFWLNLRRATARQGGQPAAASSPPPPPPSSCGSASRAAGAPSSVTPTRRPSGARRPGGGAAAQAARAGARLGQVGGDGGGMRTGLPTARALRKVAFAGLDVGFAALLAHWSPARATARRVLPEATRRARHAAARRVHAVAHQRRGPRHDARRGVARAAARLLDGRELGDDGRRARRS